MSNRVLDNITTYAEVHASELQLPSWCCVDEQGPRLAVGLVNHTEG